MNSSERMKVLKYVVAIEKYNFAVTDVIDKGCGGGDVEASLDVLGEVCNQVDSCEAELFDVLGIPNDISTIDLCKLVE